MIHELLWRARPRQISGTIGPIFGLKSIPQLNESLRQADDIVGRQGSLVNKDHAPVRLPLMRQSHNQRSNGALVVSNQGESCRCCRLQQDPIVLRAPHAALPLNYRLNVDRAPMLAHHAANGRGNVLIDR